PGGRGHEYHLTPAGKDLEGVVIAMGRWAVEWLFDEIRPDEIDAVTLTWWMHRRVAADDLPDERVVIEIAYTAPEHQTIWLVLDRGEASVCVQHPGFDPDVVITTTTVALAEVFSGHARWADAIRAGRIDVQGAPSLVRALPTWFLWSPFADVTRSRQGS